MLKPLSKSKWNYENAAHLLNRAGFGGTPEEIERLHKLGSEAAVAWFVDYERIQDDSTNPEWAKPDPTITQRFLEARRADPDKRRELQREEQRTQRQRGIELKHWWLHRMATTPRPLQEKMTLFWHGHFATSMEKVRDAYLMWRQNDLFRKMALGNWLEMLTAVAKDPAMLVWLDQAQSRKEHPNENFAREVMELFTLGEGHYTEKDITEAARALTGWSYDRAGQEFIDRPRAHDNGDKTVLGKTGNLDGRDVLERIVSQPQAAKFITAKIWNYFAGSEPSDELTSELASAFTKSGRNFKPLMETIFRSEEFYAPTVVRNRVKSPVEWLVGSVRMLERELPPPVVCFGLTRDLGQDLFAPPNVKGWDGGLSWITTNNLLARYNDAALLVMGDTSVLRNGNFAPKPAGNMMIQNRMRGMRFEPAEVDRLVTAADRKSKRTLVAALEKRFLQSKLSPKQEKVLHEYLEDREELTNVAILSAIRLVMSTPEYQLT